jgi:hypothetical protein
MNTIYLISAVIALFFIILIIEHFFASLGVKVEVTNPPNPHKSILPYFLGIVAVAGAIYFFWKHPDVIDRIDVDLVELNVNQSNNSAGATQNMYDSDPGNNRYIIGALNRKQQGRLDTILKWDKEYGRLNDTALNKLSQNDRDVSLAYYRFLKCKNLMRSSTEVIYPDER